MTCLNCSAKLKKWQNVAVDTTCYQLFKVLSSLYISENKLQEWLLAVCAVVDRDIITYICAMYM